MGGGGQSLTGKVVEKCFLAVNEFVERKYHDTSSTYGIKSFSVEQACEAGDNFLGLILSVKFSVISKNKESETEGKDEGDRGAKQVQDFDLILKSQSLTSSGRDSEKYFWSALFYKERVMYEEILAQLEQLGQAPLAPTMYHCFTEGEDYTSLLMDNLISLDYYIPDFTNLRLDECRAIMEALARFHALSLVLEAKMGIALPEKYETCGAEMMFNPGLEQVFKPMVQNTYKGILEAAEKFRPDLVGRLKEFNERETVWSRACELVKPGKSSFACLCHGDPRLKNVFLSKKKGSKDEEGGRSGCRFIDFQLTRYASPLTDLWYFLYTATEQRFRAEHLDTLLTVYFREFRATWSSFPAETQARLPPAVRAWTREKLEEEFWAMKDYGLVVAIGVIPIIYTRSEDMMDVSLANMSAAEKEKFMIQNRAQVIYTILTRNQVMRTRIFEVLQELFSRNS